MSTERCALCHKDTGHESLESEIVNLSANEAWVLVTCTRCALLAGGTLETAPDGSTYMSLGCVGGAPEETQ